MAFRFDVSIPNGEKQLADWIRERMNNNEITPSIVFFEAMKEKKREWEATQPDCLEGLKSQIEIAKKEIHRGNKLIEFSQNFLLEKLTEEQQKEYWGLWKEKVTELNNGQKIIVEEIIQETQE